MKKTHLNNTIPSKYLFILMIYTLLVPLSISASGYKNKVEEKLVQYCFLYSWQKVRKTNYDDQVYIQYKDRMQSVIFTKINKYQELYDHLISAESQQLYNNNRLAWERQCHVSLQLVDLVTIAQEENKARKKVYDLLIQYIINEKNPYIKDRIDLLVKTDRYVEKYAKHNKDNLYNRLYDFFSSDKHSWRQKNILEALSTAQSDDIMTVHEIPELKRALENGLFDAKQEDLLTTYIDNFKYLFIDRAWTGQGNINLHTYKKICTEHGDVHNYLINKLIMSEKNLRYRLYATTKKQLYNQAIGYLMDNTFKKNMQQLKNSYLQLLTYTRYIHISIAWARVVVGN